MNSSEDPDYNRIINLIRFNLNFTKYEKGMRLEIQSPDYVLEKYNHWIGFAPTVKHKIYTPDNMTDFFNKYWKTWRPDWKAVNEEKLKNILMYLYSTENLNLLNMFSKFEEYIGPVNTICSTPLQGLHHLVEEVMLPKVIEKNNMYIPIILRDLKLNNLV